MHKNIFIDTSIFVAKQFDFESELFRALIEHAQAGRVEILLPEITVWEMRAKANEFVAEGIRGLQRAASKAPILRPLGQPFSDVPGQFDVGAAQAKINANIDRFLANARVKVLPVPAESTRRVLDDYFNRQAPFGRARRKVSFPTLSRLPLCGNG